MTIGSAKPLILTIMEREAWRAYSILVQQSAIPEPVCMARLVSAWESIFESFVFAYRSVL